MSPTEIKKIAAELGLAPSKGKGQNFLIQPGVVQKIINACQLTGRERVLEVGPGLGILTEELVQRAKSVTAVELDRRLAGWLKERIPKLSFGAKLSFSVVCADILKYEPREPFDLLVTNLPYAISGAFFRQVLSWHFLPKRMIVMVQREVAKRICAQPPDMNLLALSVQLVAQPKILFRVAPGNFWPVPKVESAVMELKIGERPRDYEAIMRLAKIGYAHPRKKLASNLAFGLPARPGRVIMDLGDLGYDENVRAQELSVENWRQLMRALGPSTS